jgi:hypothetical protein
MMPIYLRVFTIDDIHSYAYSGHDPLTWPNGGKQSSSTCPADFMTHELHCTTSDKYGLEG